jgi:hypothetical protein
MHASVDQQGDFVSKVATAAITVPRIDPPQTRTFEEIRRNRSGGFSWAISEVTVIDNATVLASALIRGKAIAVSDGSFKNAKGTAGFVIEGDTRNGRVVGVNVIPGESEYQSSYQSEIGGVAGILKSLHCVCEAHGISEGAIEIGLDGDQAMKAVANDWPLDPGCPDYDLLQHVRGLIKASKLKISFRWIASHQDNHKTLAQLDRWELLNVECDGLAKGFWNSCALARSWPGSLQLGHEKWSLWIDGKKLSTIDKDRVYAYTFAPLTEAYWQKKHSLTPILIKSINWEACEEAMGRLPFGRKRWLLKHATGFCGVGRRELTRRNQDHSDCPRCGDINETARHVVECKGTGADLIFELATQKLEAHLTTIDTAPTIITAIMTRIRQWRKYGDNHLPRLRQRDLYGSHHATDEQDKIGWCNFLLGRMSKKGSDSQQKYIDSLKRKNSGRRWTSSIIQKALDIAWDMWEQRNNINNNSMHPRRAADMEKIKAKLRDLYAKGYLHLLQIDHHLFSKSVETLQLGEPHLMLQWIHSHTTATRRAGAATEDLARNTTAQRDLMRRCLE